MKFSDVVSTAKSADDTEAAAKSALTVATDADLAAHAAVVAALNTKPGKQAALVDPSGDIDEYSLNADGTDYVLSTIPGDFDIEPPPAPAAAAAPPG